MLLYDVITAIAFILILGLLVLVHELGHFLTARLFKVRVEEFGIGFPPRVYPRPAAVAARRAAGKTVYSLNLLPLGGFVRLAGENGVAVPAEASAERGGLSLSGTMTASDDPGAFASKPAWQRAVVLAAGAFNNMVLAMLLVLLILAGIGTPHSSTAIAGVAVGSPALAAGIKPGDVIQRVDGYVPQDAVDVHDIVAAHAGQRIALQVLRGGTMQTVYVVPRTQAPTCDQGSMGIETTPVNQRYVPDGLGDALNSALLVPVRVVQGIVALPSQLNARPVQACTPTTTYLTTSGPLTGIDRQAGRTFPPLTGAVPVDQCLANAGGGVAGPIGIVRQVGCEANGISTQGWVPLLSLVVDLSATLAIMNLLPVPALDGGRLLFVLISVVARRRVRPEVEALTHALGMVALLTLMFVISAHDLSNWVAHRPAF